MASPQPGIFARGSHAHAFLEYDLTLWAEPRDLLTTVAALFASCSAVGDPSLVCGLRPELWAACNPARALRHASDFLEPIVGGDGFTMPATQHDLVLWVATGTTSATFDSSRTLTTAVRDVAVLADETAGWTSASRPAAGDCHEPPPPHSQPHHVQVHPRQHR